METLYQEIVSKFPDHPCRLFNDRIELDMGKTLTIVQSEYEGKHYIVGSGAYYPNITDTLQSLWDGYQRLEQLKKQLKPLSDFF